MLQFLLLISSPLANRSLTNACHRLVPATFSTKYCAPSPVLALGWMKSCRIKPNSLTFERRVTFQKPSKHRYPTCKCLSCDLPESPCCQAASALQEEPAGFSFFTVGRGKQKLIKPQPEVRMHQQGQRKQLAQRSHKQSLSLRPRLNNY